MASLTCKHCDKLFVARTNRHKDRKPKYCSRGCMSKAFRVRVTCKCETCGLDFDVIHSRIKKGHGRFCSKECHDIAQRTGSMDAHGYRIIRVNKKKVKEHRHIMALFLGRELTEDEIVHHIDGDKLNNAIENLQLFPSHSEHSSLHRTLERLEVIHD